MCATQEGVGDVYVSSGPAGRGGGWYTGQDPALRRVPGGDGDPQHRGVHRVGSDHGVLHPHGVDPERGSGRARRSDDLLPAADPDRVHRRGPGPPGTGGGGGGGGHGGGGARGGGWGAGGGGGGG